MRGGRALIGACGAGSRLAAKRPERVAGLTGWDKAFSLGKAIFFWENPREKHIFSRKSPSKNIENPRKAVGKVCL